MKKLIVFLLLFSSGVLNFIKSQDTIVFKSGESKITKILQVRQGELTCKDFLNLEGPDYIYELKKIKEIHFKNGIIQTYNSPDEKVTENANNVLEKSPKESAINFSTPPIRFRTYKEKNDYYKSKPYYKEIGDPYNPVVVGIASYFLPGLGQMICNETGRGFAFLGGAAASYIVTTIGIVGISSEANQYFYEDNFSEENVQIFSFLTLAGLLTYIGIDIWSIVDAVHAAKVNNLYQRDLHKQNQVKLRLLPYIDVNKPAISLNNQPEMGLSLRVNF